MDNCSPSTYRYDFPPQPDRQQSFPPQQYSYLPQHPQYPLILPRTSQQQQQHHDYRRNYLSVQRGAPPSWGDTPRRQSLPPRLQPPSPLLSIQRNDFGMSFHESYIRSLDWKNPKRASPLFDLMRDNNKIKERGWLRNQLNIPTIKNNPKPLRYHDLLIKTTPSLPGYSNKNIMDVFYHAFDMNNNNLNQAIRKRRGMLDNQNKTTTIIRSPLQQRLTNNSMQSIEHRKRKADQSLSVLKTPSSKMPTKGLKRITWSDAKGCKTPDVVNSLVSNFESHMQSNTCATNSTIKAASNGYKTTVKICHTTYDGRFDSHRFLDALLPVDYSVKRKDYIEQLKEKAEICLGVQRMLDKNQYTGSDEHRQMIAGGIAMVPHISLESAQYLIAAVRHSTIRQLGFNATAEQVSKTSPSASVLKGALVNLAASCLVTKLKVINKAEYASLATDKGHKDGVDHMVKILASFDEEKDMVDFFTLDMDSAGNSDEEAADAIKFSLDTKEVNTLISSLGTDSGGGGTTDSFMEALKNQDVIHPVVHFVSPCSLHILQLLFATPIEKVYGLGGVGSRNAIQLLHSMHDLEKNFGRDVWKKMMADEIEKLQLPFLVPRAMPRPVTTRWWWLGIACDIALKYWKAYHSIAKGCVNAYGSTSYPNIVGSSLDSMMKEETFYVHILFISCFAKAIINPHFDFLQSHGVHSKQAGYNSEAMLVRTFLINQDVDEIQDEGWQSMEAFAPIMDHLNGARWMTKEEEEELDTKKAEQKKAGPSAYEKQNKQSDKHVKRLTRDITTRKRIDTHLQALMSSRPDNYWHDLDKTTGETLEAILHVLQLPKRLKCPTTGKTRAVNKGEKKASVLAFGELSRNQFGLEYDKNANQIKKLDENLAGEHLSRKERLLRTFELYDDEDWCNLVAFAVPLRDLFGCEDGQELNGIGITVDSINSKLIELREDIESTIQEIRHRVDAEDSRDEEDDIVAEERERLALRLEETNVSDFEGNEEENDKPLVSLCVRQINIIMKIVKQQNDKHFQRWADKLIYLGVASEKETARVVADLLLGKDMEHYNGEVFTSPVHNRQIDLHEFGRYIYETCTDSSLEDVQSKLYFIRNKDGLQRLSEGEDLWISTDNHVSLLRTFVKRAVLIVPSNTQFVELCVKEGAYIGATNRDESQRSVLGIIRSFTIREVNNKCVEKAKNRELRANQHTEGGTIGDRSMTKKNNEQDIKTRPIIKGSKKTIELLDLLEKINTNEDEQSQRQRQRLVKILSDRKLSYNQRKKTKRLARYRERSKINKKMNKDQHRQDIKHTDMTLGRIAYSSLRNECIDEVKIELDTYEVYYDGDEGIKKLANLLKEAVMKDHGKEFEKSFHPTSEPLTKRFPFSIRQEELS